MAVAFRTVPAVSLFEMMNRTAPEKRFPKYQVYTYRSEEKMVIAVDDGDSNLFTYWRREVSLKWVWYRFKSPRERIQDAIEKANKICDRLNREEMFMAHESEISVRE